VQGDSAISDEVLARHAADAAHEFDGVTLVVQRVRRGIRVEGDATELHLALPFGVSIPQVGAAVQENVAAYLERMTDAPPALVNVVVDEVDVLA
jgi:uncharacterized alkaline shock family protein YloU